MKWPWQRRKETAVMYEVKDVQEPAPYLLNPFLRLIGPRGPFNTPEEDERLYQEYLRGLNLPELLDALQNAHARYPRWLNDVQCVAYDFADLHPEHAAQVDEALRSAGFEVDD